MLQHPVVMMTTCRSTKSIGRRHRLLCAHPIVVSRRIRLCDRVPRKCRLHTGTDYNIGQVKYIIIQHIIALYVVCRVSAKIRTFCVEITPRTSRRRSYDENDIVRVSRVGGCVYDVKKQNKNKCSDSTPNKQRSLRWKTKKIKWNITKCVSKKTYYLLCIKKHIIIICVSSNECDSLFVIA